MENKDTRYASYIDAKLAKLSRLCRSAREGETDEGKSESERPPLLQELVSLAKGLSVLQLSVLEMLPREV